MALIMVADDEPDIRDLLKEYLSARGHQVETVADGVQMIEKAKAWRPQLIIADLMMPGTYGSAAAKTLRQDPLTAAIPVVFLTAVAAPQAQKVVPQAPNVRLMHKPVELPELLKAIAELLAPPPPPGP